jgi:serine/threonine protein kinase
MVIRTLQTNYIVIKMINELHATPKIQSTQYQFKLDVDIRRTSMRSLFQAFGKAIYEVEWVSRQGPPIVIVKINGATAIREASFYVQLSCHPHIVRTFGLVESNPGSVILLQEYAPEGDLSALLQEHALRPTEQVLLEMFIQLSDAMICLADNGIVHGDLACRNVLVFRSNATEPKDNLVKLTDFGLTRASTLYSVVDSTASSTMTTVPGRYAAPEILRTMDGENYSEKSDVYSMGVLMWEACSLGALPYSSVETDKEIRKRKLKSEKLPKPSCSHDLWDTMKECWHQQPQDRPDFRTLKQYLLTLQFKTIPE